MIRLSRFLVVLMLCMIIVPLSVLSMIHYQGLKQFATQTLITQLDSEVHVTQEKLDNEVRAITSGLRLLTGHETIIKGVSSLFYSTQVRERFESFINRYSMVSSLYLLTRDGRVRENYGGKIRPVEKSREIRELLHNLDRAYESGVTGGRVVILDSPELVPGDDHRALVFISIINSVIVRNSDSLQGYLIAIVPFSNMLEQVSTTSKLHRSMTQLGESLPPDEAGQISQSLRLIIGEKDYSPSVNLYIKVSRSPESMSLAVTEAIRPFISYQLAVMLVMIILFVLFSRPIFRAFNVLYGIIQRMEAGQLVRGTTSRIWEFAHTERLLIDMQARIHQQLATLEHNNHDLAVLAKDKDRYLSELTLLNQNLEEKVQERTNKLALILQRIEISNRIYNQVIYLRQELSTESSDQSVMNAVIKRLHACELDVPFLVVLTVANAPALSYRHPEFMGDPLLPVQEPNTDYHFSDGIYSVPLPPPFGGGWLLFQTSTLREEELKGMLLFARELSSFLENRALTSRLAFWARTDGLTGLGNRIAFDQTMADLETSLDKEVGLFLIDVNGLKELNDTRGHEAGDALLRTVASRLQNCLKELPGSLYRIGGDEFTILLEGDGVAHHEELLRRLREAQFQPATLAGREHGISFSVGYADSQHTPFSLLYKLADKVMYQQKQAYYERKRSGDEQTLEHSEKSV
jgi:diguanylate cyclase (GGDEF)-like protein